MSEDLTEQVIKALRASGANDYDQRSALGMAYHRTLVNKPIVRDSLIMGKRDDLAEALVGLLSGVARAEAQDALAEARKWLNAPFLDPTMNGQQFKARIDKEERR